MPDVLVFGATGYTGRLTCKALAARGADFIVAGRDRSKLETLANATGASAIAMAQVGDVSALAEAAARARVLLSCVGPFTQLGHTAAEAALRAGVHYLDCTGEGAFIEEVSDRYGDAASERGIVMAPALGFDEVPADVAATMATEGLVDADLVLTYAVSVKASRGTVLSALGVLAADARWIQDGAPTRIATGAGERWAPLPPPLGPSPSLSFPAAEGHLAPLHLDLAGLRTFLVADAATSVALRMGRSVLKGAEMIPGIGRLVTATSAALPEGPSATDRAGATWTVLAEAASGPRRRSVVISGTDAYGLTAELLAAAAVEMARPDYEVRGLVAPVQALPLSRWQQELATCDASIAVYGS